MLIWLVAFESFFRASKPWVNMEILDLQGWSKVKITNIYTVLYNFQNAFASAILVTLREKAQYFPSV